MVSTKMQKTIVVEVEMRKAHPKYKRIMRTTKKFYAHDEQNSARLGDVVRIRETQAAEQAEALAAGRDCAALIAGQIEDTAGNSRCSRSCQVRRMRQKEKNPWLCK